MYLTIHSTERNKMRNFNLYIPHANENTKTTHEFSFGKFEIFRCQANFKFITLNI